MRAFPLSLCLGALLGSVLLLLVLQADAECDVCGTNNIACASETEFYLCKDNKVSSAKKTCPTGTVCTALSLKCVGGAEPDCARTISCGCDGTRLFACTSRTTFAQCNGKEIMQVGTCPVGYLCDSSRPGVCIDECKLEGHPLECDRDAP